MLDDNHFSGVESKGKGEVHVASTSRISSVSRANTNDRNKELTRLKREYHQLVR